MRSLLLLLLLVWSSQAFAAPAVIGTPVFDDSGASAASSLTISATCPSGNSNVIAIGCVSTRKAGATAVDMGAVTWNGSAMTAVGAAEADTASNGTWTRMYVHTSPTCDNSAHNYVINTNTGTNFLVGGIVFLKDANTASPHDTQATAQDTTGAPTVNVSSATGDLVVDCVTARNSAVDLAVGAGQTIMAAVAETTNATGSTNVEGASSREAGAATVTMSWTVGATPPSWTIVGVSINPAAAAGRRRMVPPQRFLQLPAPFFGVFEWLSPSAWAKE